MAGPTVTVTGSVDVVEVSATEVTVTVAPGAVQVITAGAVGPAGADGAAGADGPNQISDTTAIGTLTAESAPPFLLGARNSGVLVRKVTAIPLSLIAQGGAVSNQVLAWNGSVWAPATVSATPGGSSGQLQYNSSSAFAGAAFSAVAASGNLLTLTAGADADVPIRLVGNSATQSGSLLSLHGTAGTTVARAELALNARGGGAFGRKCTLAAKADDLTLHFGTDGTDFLSLQMYSSVVGGSPGGIFGTSQNNGGFGFQANNAGPLYFGSSSTSSAAPIKFGVRPGDGAICDGCTVNFYYASLANQLRSALTTSAGTFGTWQHHTSGTPGSGFGGTVAYQLDSSTAANQDAAGVAVTWATATHASRKARAVWNVYDTAARECIRMEASGSEPMLGFYGVTAIARAVLATGAGATVDNVITALQNLGLVKQS